MCARIRSLDLYSGHADGTELRQWIKERLPIQDQLFLVHGEAPAMAGLAARLDGIVAARNVLQTRLDEVFVLTPDRAQSLSPATPPRLSPEKVAHLDWHNDVSRLLLEINEGLLASPDEKTRAALIRRLQRALRDSEREGPWLRHRTFELDFGSAPALVHKFADGFIS